MSTGHNERQKGEMAPIGSGRIDLASCDYDLSAQHTEFQRSKEVVHVVGFGLTHISRVLIGSRVGESISKFISSLIRNSRLEL